MLNELDGIDWASYPQPEWNSASSVPDALRALAAATEVDAGRAYHRFLYAVGNDHCGTYYPVVLPTIPFLSSLLVGVSGAARARALDVLVDLVCSFEPEPEYETVASVTSAERSKCFCTRP